MLPFLLFKACFGLMGVALHIVAVVLGVLVNGTIFQRDIMWTLSWLEVCEVSQITCELSVSPIRTSLYSSLCFILRCFLRDFSRWKHIPRHSCQEFHLKRTNYFPEWGIQVCSGKIFIGSRGLVVVVVVRPPSVIDITYYLAILVCGTVKRKSSD